MKKMILAGVCGALLLGSVNNAEALSEEAKENLKIALVVSGFSAGIGSALHVAVYRVHRMDYFQLRENNLPIFDILKKIDSSNLSFEDAAQEVLLIFSSEHHGCHAALDRLNQILHGGYFLRRDFKKRGLRSLQLSFRWYRKYGFFKGWARDWVEKIERKIEQLNKIAKIIKESPAYEREKQEKGLQKLQVDLNQKLISGSAQ